MELIFLGTGTGVPSARRGSPGLAVVEGDAALLIDSGPGVLRQLARAGRSYNDLDAILYTHFHPDHTADLAPYLFATRYWPGFTRRTPARIVGPEGLVKLAGHFRDAYGRWVEPPDDLVVWQELPVGRRSGFDIGPFRIEAGPVHHNPESLGYRLADADGRVLAVTGDTEYGPDLVALARDADLLVAECSFPDGHERDGHMTPAQVGRAAREARVKALALTHFYPETDGCDLLAALRREYDGPATLAEDLMRLRL